MEYTFELLSIITGIPKVTLWRWCKRDGNWGGIMKKGIGGERMVFEDISKLPSKIQNAIVIYNKDNGNMTETLNMLPVVCPSAASMALEILDPMPIMSMSESFTQKRETWTPETAISIDDIRDKRIGRILAILREVDEMPQKGFGRHAWIKAIAIKHEITLQTIYKWIKKYEKKGIAGLRHTKPYKNEPRKWTQDAVDFWIGLCLKREHRHINRKELYSVLVIESHRRGWDIGCYESANWWYEKKATPLLIAYRDGGLRALDNMLPPILRDYSDLDPFEIIVGDQHRWNYWITSDYTNDEVFRSEGYAWLDLRTDIIYGAAFARKYDANLMGLALRIGMRVFGVFGSIYTDNGRPELSKYITGILADIRNLGMSWETTEDYPMDILDADAENINPYIELPGTHRKAIVKNAKAKKIEGLFRVLEDILSSHFMLAGNVKNLHGDIHAQDIDQEEAKKLAKQGKLLKESEFYLMMYKAIDYYNKEKHHRGLYRRWPAPKPAVTTPMGCLKSCYDAGWRPVRISDEAADLIFLQKAKRIVRMGRVEFKGEFYEHDALLPLHKKSVDIRYNPIEADTLLIFQGNKYLCPAHPVEYSSMKNPDLTSEKIHQKRKQRKDIADRFRSITAPIPDFRHYSEVPQLEKVVTQIEEDKRQIAIEIAQINRTVTQKEIDEHIAMMEQGLPLPAKTSRPLPERPKWFANGTAHFHWIIEFLKAGGELSETDELFKNDFLSEHPEQKEFFEFNIAYGG